MSCCETKMTMAKGVGIVADRTGGDDKPTGQIAAELTATGQSLDGGHVRYVLSVPSMRCGGCVRATESALAANPEVVSARANLTRKTIAVTATSNASAQSILAVLSEAGYAAAPLDQEHTAEQDTTGKFLLRALAVAGFAAMNVMLLSVSVWSGAEGTTRELFHLLSAVIALPAVAYSGRVFFSPAWVSLRNGRIGMDVPISLAVLLATGMSLFQTIQGGEEVWFDASLMLLFFLLIGRYLDHLMREKAGAAFEKLAKLTPQTAAVVTTDGIDYEPVRNLQSGTLIQVSSGQRIPLDGIIEQGRSELDTAAVTGESLPQSAEIGDPVVAGSLNLSAPIQIRTGVAGGDDTVSRMLAELASADGSKGNYVRLADRFAAIYAPAVHILALATFIGWMVLGSSWQEALMVAIAVLIITCPCALGLAVPIVQVVASGRLLENHVLMRSGSALERLAECDTLVVDKTGTLTTGRPQVVEVSDNLRKILPVAAGLASQSNHPYSRALIDLAKREGVAQAKIEKVEEFAGLGLSGIYGGKRVRMGKSFWVCENNQEIADSEEAFAICIEGQSPVCVKFSETMRTGASRFTSHFAALGWPVHMLSGDNETSVNAIVARLGLPIISQSGCTPSQKTNYVETLAKQGARPLMIGDGINDAPALAHAHASMAPGEASDVGRSAADFVLLRSSLDQVSFVHDISIRAMTLIRQNFGLALAYNAIAVPLAIGCQATPLFAAIAMSSSSLIVVANAMRLRLGWQHGGGSREQTKVKSDFAEASAELAVKAVAS